MPTGLATRFLSLRVVSPTFSAKASHPLVGEPTFIDAISNDIPFDRQALHAYQLGFRHPLDQSPIKMEAPLPDDFVELLERLRGFVEGALLM